MRTETIRQNLARSPSGFTINQSGDRWVGNGYAVSISNHKVTNHNNLTGIVNQINRLSRLLKIKTSFVGGWRDGNNTYLDYTVIMEKKRDAVAIGRSYNQESIYNFKQKKTSFL